MSVTSCVLKSTTGDVEIKLPDGVAVVLGRSPTTRIKDPKCSRHQLEFKADWANKKVSVRQLGSNPSRVRGSKDLLKGDEETLYHFATVEFSHGTPSFRVEFVPPPSLGITEPTSPPPLRDAEEDEMGRRRTANSAKRSNGDSAVSPASKRQKTARSEEAEPPKTVQKEVGLWKSVDDDSLLIFTPAGVTGKSKIAAYDMDGTLITTKSGRVFAVDKNDWQIIFPEVVPKLKSLTQQGYKIVIMTNQSGVTAGKITVKDLKAKLEQVVAALGVPVQVLAATSTSIFRKPNVGMWEYLEKEANDGVEVDRSQSFYCGDAAGRVKDWAPKKKKDFSCGDRLFALNLGVDFHTPEDHFLPQPAGVFGTKPKPAKFEINSFDPRPLLEDTSSSLTDPPDAKVVSGSTELVVMVGFPGSGKSSFCARHLGPAGYVVANRDTVGTWQKCVKILEQSLAEGKSVVVDNTNGDAASRKRYVDAAKEAGVPARCFVMDVSYEHSQHNNRFRELTDKNHEKVSTMVFNMYRAKYAPPTLSEGFSEIVKIRFKPEFESDEHKNLYMRFLLEK